MRKGTILATGTIVGAMLVGVIGLGGVKNVEGDGVKNNQSQNSISKAALAEARKTEEIKLKGATLVEEGKLEEAIKIFDEILKDKPDEKGTIRFKEIALDAKNMFDAMDKKDFVKVKKLAAVLKENEYFMYVTEQAESMEKIANSEIDAKREREKEELAKKEEQRKAEKKKSEFDIFNPTRKLTKSEARQVLIARVGDRVGEEGSIKNEGGREYFTTYYVLRESAVYIGKVDLNTAEVALDVLSDEWEKYVGTKEELQKGTAYKWETQ